MSSKMKLVLGFVAVLLSGCLHSQSSVKNDAKQEKSPAIAHSTDESLKMQISNFRRFEALTPDFVFDQKARNGFSAFDEDLANEGSQTVHVWFKVTGSVRVETRIHEEANYHNLTPVHFARNRVSYADFAVDQLDVSRKSGEPAHYATKDWISFDLAAGEEVHLAWIAHALPGELCPFWAHHWYGGVGFAFLVPATLDWSILGSSIAFQVVRSLKIQTSDLEMKNGEPTGQVLIDSEDGAEANPLAGNGTRTATDTHFGCDGLMELLPSN